MERSYRCTPRGGGTSGFVAGSATISCGACRRDWRSIPSPAGGRGGNRYVEPEFIVCDERFRPDTVPASEVLLLIEVADTSRRCGMGTKAKIYASAGVREYWVVDAVTLSTRVFREPSADGYGAWRDVPSEEMVEPHLVPELAVALETHGLNA